MRTRKPQYEEERVLTIHLVTKHTTNCKLMGSF